MSFDFELDLAVPALARLPTAVPWRMAGHLAGRQEKTLAWLQALFARICPEAAADSHAHWARAHLTMLAQERLDAMAFARLGRSGGPRVALHGAEPAIQMARDGQGFILVLNHYDRLLTAPVVLAKYGVTTNVLTMPVIDNPELGEAQRRFLVRKIRGYTQVTGGRWHTTAESLRVVHDTLRSGQAWVILADAWGADFARLRSHPFLGGSLRLPTGIERLARSTGVPLLHASTRTLAPDSLAVTVESLPQSPELAIDQVIQQLHADVRERPWAWWHWGLWDQMWHPAPEEVNRDAH